MYPPPNPVFRYSPVFRVDVSVLNFGAAEEREIKVCKWVSIFTDQLMRNPHTENGAQDW